MGETPCLSATYDAKSYESVQRGVYPSQGDVQSELAGFQQVLKKYHVEVLRPSSLPALNQIFSRDIAFVIEDEVFISNTIADRADELQAYLGILSNVAPAKLVYLPEDARAEGGDVLVWNDDIFVGISAEDRAASYKTARTNQVAVDFIQSRFPQKKVHAFPLKKHDTDPRAGILHLDCCFQPVGNALAIIYREGFENQRDVDFLVHYFGEENIFFPSQEEMYLMYPNIFSISPKVVVAERGFERLHQWLEGHGIWVEKIPYFEISKMGGLLRCSTLPLFRDKTR